MLFGWKVVGNCVIVTSIRNNAVYLTLIITIAATLIYIFLFSREVYSRELALDNNNHLYVTKRNIFALNEFHMIILQYNESPITHTSRLIIDVIKIDGFYWTSRKNTVVVL